MNRFHTTGRLAVILAGLAGALLAFWTDVPAVGCGPRGGV
jgi:hypothetical protein